MTKRKRKRLSRGPNRLGGDARSWRPEPKPRPSPKPRPTKAQLAALVKHFRPFVRNR